MRPPPSLPGRSSRWLTGAATAAALALCACGGGGGGQAKTSPTTPTGGGTQRSGPAPSGGSATSVDPAAVGVVRAWAHTLRRGDVPGAAGYFAVPSVVANGSAPVRLSSRRALRAFNASLPCGARVVDTQPAPHGFLIATFLLTERPGAGACGTGTGHTARVAFRIRDGRIVDWLRVQDIPAAGSGTPS
ncbi:MAG: hypothetical protein JWQ48_3724 [Conexibacter sp.]|nr:hypothetical protein [Conexibacter sp.]